MRPSAPPAAIRRQPATGTSSHRRGRGGPLFESGPLPARWLPSASRCSLQALRVFELETGGCAAACWSAAWSSPAPHGAVIATIPVVVLARVPGLPRLETGCIDCSSTRSRSCAAAVASSSLVQRGASLVASPAAAPAKNARHSGDHAVRGTSSLDRRRAASDAFNDHADAQAASRTCSSSMGDRKKRRREAIYDLRMPYDELLAQRIRDRCGHAEADGQQDVRWARFLVGGKMAIAASGQVGILGRVDPEQSSALVAKTPAEVMVMRATRWTDGSASPRRTCGRSSRSPRG